MIAGVILFCGFCVLCFLAPVIYAVVLWLLDWLRPLVRQ